MDKLFEEIGSFGKYQKLILVLIGGISSLVSMNFYGTIFVTSEPELICSALSNSTKLPTDSCEIWSIINSAEHPLKDQYECYFDKNYYGSTIITEWGLVCDKKYLASLTQTIYMIGTISGMVGGVISDRFGRKLSNRMFIVLLSSTIIICQIFTVKELNFSISFRYMFYCINMFLSGLFVNSLYCTAYVLLLELTTDKYHTLVSNVNLYFYVVGEIIVLISYYLSKSWSILSWVIALYSILFVFLTWFLLPESPRWLIAQRRFKEAEAILKRISVMNNKSIRFNNDLSDQMKSLNDSEETDMDEKLSSAQILKSIFYSRQNLFKMSLLIFIWISISLLYFGVSMGMTSLDHVNPYTIYLLSAVVEVAGLSLCYLNDKLGRKKALCIYLCIASIACSAVAFLPQESHSAFQLTWIFVMRMLLALAGKCMVSAAFNTCYMYTAELYTTSVRNTVILFLTCVGGFGSLISPQINLLKNVVWNPLPYIIYSASAFFALFSLLFLPETHQETH